MGAVRSHNAVDAPHRLFIRDDDIGSLTEPLRFFVELFVERGLPVSYQIIPAQLTSECAAFMLAMSEAAPHLVEFGQHGLHHRMTLRGRQLKREFGPERGYGQQKADIEEGLRLLRDRLGPNVPIQVFTPPQHKYDANTVRAAAEVGHRVFSAANYPSFHHQVAYDLGRRLGLSSVAHQGISYDGRRRPEADIKERSIAIAVDNGRAILSSAGGIGMEIGAAARRSNIVGLMFHHEVYGDGDGQRRLTEIADELQRLGAEAFCRLGDLA